MRKPIRRGGRTAALLAAVGLAAGLATLAGPGALPAGAVQSDAVPIPTDPGVSGPQSGTLANGVGWSVDTGQGNPEQGYAIYPPGSPQTWTFSEPVSVTFTIAGLNCAGEAMQLPVGSMPVEIGAGHSYDAATGVVTGGTAAAPGTGSTFVAPGLRTELVLAAVGAGSCGRGPSAITLARPEPFDCSASTVFIGQDAPTQLQRLVAGSGSSDFEPVGTPSIPYNAMGYNTADDLIYAAAGEGSIIAIDGTGEVLVLGTPEPPIGRNHNVGAIGPDGRFYVGSGGSSTLNVIDLATLTNTPIALDAAVGTADLTFIDGLLWGDGGPSGGLTRIDPATGHVTRFPTSIPGSVTAGAAWTYPNGNLGLSDNISGNVYQVAITDGAGDTPGFSVVAVNPGPSSSQNDGTSCEGLPADLSLAKTSTTPVLPGGQITWTITVTNDGPGTSTGYVVKDVIPAAVTGLSTPTPGCSFAGNELTCVGGVLAAGDSATITVTGTAPVDAGNLANSASVTGNEVDPDPSDNGATSTTWVATVGGLCRGTAVGVLGIRLGSANNPEAPCRTESSTLVNINQTIGNAFPWPLSALNSTLRATAVGGSTLSGPRFASAEAHVATASVNVPSLGLSLAVTGVQTTAASQLGADCSSGTVEGTSVIAAVVLNGVPIVIGDQPVSIPLLGLGGLYLNQRVIQGRTIIQRAVFLDLPGTALDVAIAESKAGVACGTPPVGP